MQSAIKAILAINDSVVVKPFEELLDSSNAKLIIGQFDLGIIACNFYIFQLATYSNTDR